MKLAAAVAAGARLKPLGAETVKAAESGASLPNLEFNTAVYRVTMAADQPGFAAFAVDSLGTKKLDENMMLPLGKPSRNCSVS